VHIPRTLYRQPHALPTLLTFSDLSFTKLLAPCHSPFLPFLLPSLLILLSLSYLTQLLFPTRYLPRYRNSNRLFPDSGTVVLYLRPLFIDHSGSEMSPALMCLAWCIFSNGKQDSLMLRREKRCHGYLRMIGFSAGLQQYSP